MAHTITKTVSYFALMLLSIFLLRADGSERSSCCREAAPGLPESLTCCAVSPAHSSIPEPGTVLRGIAATTKSCTTGCLSLLTAGGIVTYKIDETDCSLRDRTVTPFTVDRDSDNGISYSPDGQCLAVTDSCSKLLKFFKVGKDCALCTDGKEIHTFFASAVAFSPKNHCFIVGKRCGRPDLYKVKNCKPHHEQDFDHKYTEPQFSFSPDGKCLAVIDTVHDKLQIFAMECESEGREHRNKEKCKDIVTPPGADSVGKDSAKNVKSEVPECGVTEKECFGERPEKCHEEKKKKECCSVKERPVECFNICKPTSVAFSPCGKCLVVTTADGYIYTFTVKDCCLKQQLGTVTVTGSIVQAAFSAEGNCLAVAYDDLTNGPSLAVYQVSNCTLTPTAGSPFNPESLPAQTRGIAWAGHCLFFVTNNTLFTYTKAAPVEGQGGIFFEKRLLECKGNHLIFEIYVANGSSCPFANVELVDCAGKGLKIENVIAPGWCVKKDDHSVKATLPRLCPHERHRILVEACLNCCKGQESVDNTVTLCVDGFTFGPKKVEISCKKPCLPKAKKQKNAAPVSAPAKEQSAPQVTEEPAVVAEKPIEKAIQEVIVALEPKNEVSQKTVVEMAVTEKVTSVNKPAKDESLSLTKPLLFGAGLAAGVGLGWALWKYTR